MADMNSTVLKATEQRNGSCVRIPSEIGDPVDQARWQRPSRSSRIGWILGAGQLKVGDKAAASDSYDKE